MQPGNTTTPAVSKFAITCVGTRAVKDSHAQQSSENAWENTYYIDLSTMRWRPRYGESHELSSKPIARVSADEITFEDDPPLPDLGGNLRLVFYPKTMQLSMEQSVGYYGGGLVRTYGGFVTTKIAAVCNYGGSLPHSPLFIARSKHMSWRIMQKLMSKTATALNRPMTGGTFQAKRAGYAWSGSGHTFRISGNGVEVLAITGFSGACQGDWSIQYLPPLGYSYDENVYRISVNQNGVLTAPGDLDSTVSTLRDIAHQAGISLTAQDGDSSASSACASK